MTETLEILLQQYSYLILIGVIIVDSFPFVGAVLPEEFVIALSGFFLGRDLPHFLFLVFLSSITMLIGQSIQYYLGYRYGLKVLRFFRLSDRKIKILRKQLKRHMLPLNIFLRFASTYRTIIAVLSGFEKYPLKTFYFYEVIFAFGRSLAYVGLGSYVALSVEHLEGLINQSGVFLLLIASIGFVMAVIATSQIKKYLGD